MDAKAEVERLIALGRSGQGGGRMDHLVLERLAQLSSLEVVALYRYLQARPPSEMSHVLVYTLARLIAEGRALGRAYGREDVYRATSGLTYLPAVPETYTAPPASFKPERYQGSLEEVALAVLTQRLTTAVDTILGGPGDQVTTRLERIAENEPVAEAQRAYQREGARAGLGYRRRINPDACELCFWLWKGGYVYPATQPMHRHTGCRCYPEFTTDRVGAGRRTEAERQVEQEFMQRYPTRSRRG